MTQNSIIQLWQSEFEQEALQKAIRKIIKKVAKQIEWATASDLPKIVTFAQEKKYQLAYQRSDYFEKEIQKGYFAIPGILTIKEVTLANDAKLKAFLIVLNEIQEMVNTAKELKPENASFLREKQPSRHIIKCLKTVLPAFEEDEAEIVKNILITRLLCRPQEAYNSGFTERTVEHKELIGVHRGFYSTKKLFRTDLYNFATLDPHLIEDRFSQIESLLKEAGFETFKVPYRHGYLEEGDYYSYRVPLHSHEVIINVFDAITFQKVFNHYLILGRLYRGNYDNNQEFYSEFLLYQKKAVEAWKYIYSKTKDGCAYHAKKMKKHFADICNSSYYKNQPKSIDLLSIESFVAQLY